MFSAERLTPFKEKRTESTEIQGFEAGSDNSCHLKKRLYQTIEHLIVQKSVDTFLFGSKSRFNELCYELVTCLKEKYPHIKRIYVRAEYPYIEEQYKTYLLQSYEETYFPEKILGAGRFIYVERNYEMIKQSHFCVVYFDEKNISKAVKSGTKIALAFAKRQKKQIFLFP